MLPIKNADESLKAPRPSKDDSIRRRGWGPGWGPTDHETDIRPMVQFEYTRAWRDRLRSSCAACGHTFAGIQARCRNPGPKRRAKVSHASKEHPDSSSE